MDKSAAILTLAACLLACGCASVGDTMYPSLNIPVRVLDLRVAEHAGKLVIDFTIPDLTTDKVTIKRIRDVELTAGDHRIPVTKDVPGPVHVEAPVSGLVANNVAIRVRLIGSKGHASEWSNAVTMNILPPLAPPSELKVVGVADGVKLTWNASGENHFRIFRGKDQIGESDTPQYVDKTAEFGKTYDYAVQGVNGAADSDMSHRASITTKDTFPPAVPSGLSVSPGTTSIELVWERNIESDFKGYSVYRSVENGPFERIAEGLEGPSFSDKNVVPGKRYRYTVAAVDQAGNESSQSAPVEITL